MKIYEITDTNEVHINLSDIKIDFTKEYKEALNQITIARTLKSNGITMQRYPQL